MVFSKASRPYLSTSALFFFAVGQAARTADTAADTSHAFNEVGVQPVLAFLKQGELAGFNAVTGAGGLTVKSMLLLQTFCHCIGQTAPCEDTSEVGGVVQHSLIQTL